MDCRETSRPTIAADLMSTQQQLTDLKCFVQKSIIHMQDIKRLSNHHMEDTDELTLQNEVQNLSVELLHSRQSCDGWREKHHVQVRLHGQLFVCSCTPCLRVCP